MNEKMAPKLKKFLGAIDTFLNNNCIENCITERRKLQWLMIKKILRICPP